MSALKVFHNHLGFRPKHGRKRIVVPDVPEARNIFGDGVFWVYEQNRFSMELLNSPRQHEYVYRASMCRKRDDFGSWLVGDFSSVNGDGIYQAFCGNVVGPSFAIRNDVWRRILPECIRYFQVQSCGRDVPGWHGACHLDDGYIPDEKRFIQAVGGWHDAGDFRKWVSSTALNAIALLIGHRLWGGREEKLGLPPGTLLAEALQGVHYFLAMQKEDGSLYNNVGGGQKSFHDNLDNRYTDNIPQSGDERLVFTNTLHTAAKFTTLYAMYAEALGPSNPDLSARCLQAAAKSLAYDRRHGPSDADSLQWRAWGYLELWRATGEAQHKAAAIATMDALLALQVTDFVGGQKVTRGFFRADATRDEFHHKHIGADYPMWVLCEFLTVWPGDDRAGRWRAALSLWVDDFVRVFTARNPWGLVPYSFYSEPQADHPHCLYRPLGDKLYYRYFMADSKFGCNARLSLTAACLAGAARVLGRKELLDEAYPMLEWILGANPFGISTCNGVGLYQVNALSFQMGNIPGGVTMGVHGGEQDLPKYDNPWLCSDEYYGYQTSQFLWAILAAESVEY